MRNTLRYGYIALISIFVIAISLSCSSNSSTTYSIEGSVSPSEAGSVSPENGEYEEGDEVEVRAEANNTWMFSSWQGDISGTENPATITVDDDLVFTAVFEKLQYPLNITIEGSGSVEENILQSKMTDYEIGTEVELNAVADEGWVFVEWKEDLAGNDNPQTLEIDEGKNVTAVFERRTYPLTVDTEGEGNVTEEIVENPAKDYKFETVVEVTANSAEGWQFARWEGDLEGTENPIEITMNGEKEITAVFERQDYELTVEVTGEGSVAQELVEEAAKTSYPYESVIELTANSESGWRFVRWEGDLDGDENPKEITLDSDKTVTAVFADDSFDLNVTIDGEGEVNEEVTGQAKTSYGFNTIVELTAEPDVGWKFDHWEGDLSGNDNPKEITIDEEKNVIAVFQEIEYEVNVSTDGTGNVSLSPDKNSYTYGEDIEIEADPGNSWVFSHWEGDLTGSNNPETITVESNLSITAVFGSIADVKTEQISDMRITSVSGNGIVEDDGGLEVTERGVCWSEDEDPDLSDSCSQNGDGTGSFSSDISGLRQGFDYYVRAYATNKAGTAYGDAVEFKAGYVSHGYIEGVTPSNDSQFENRSYKLVKSNWKGGENKVWTELNLGANDYVKTVTDSNIHRNGWFFQFNRKQGHYHNGDIKVPDVWDDNINEDSDWEAKNDPCRASFGGNWRVPTSQEWYYFQMAPASDGGMQGGDYNDAFDSLLRLHAAGALDDNAAPQLNGSAGLYWSSNQENSDKASFLSISSSDSNIGADGDKSAALTVRCIKK